MAIATPDNPTPAQDMEWQFTHKRRTLFIVDLPIEVLDDIAKRHGVPWFAVTGRPYADGAVGLDVAKACAERLAVALPDPLTGRVLPSLFQLVEDTATPELYVDGLPEGASGRATS